MLYHSQIQPIKHKNNKTGDPLGRPTVYRDHCFCTCHPSVPTFQNLAKQNKAKTMFAIGETVGLAEWIIDDTCLVCISLMTKN